MLTSAQFRPRRRQQGARSAPTEKCRFAALLPLVVLLAAGVPALAADSIGELLHQDETDSHNDALRRDLNAFTEEQWQYYFKIEHKRPDSELGDQLIVREREERQRSICEFGIARDRVASSGATIMKRIINGLPRTTLKPDRTSASGGLTLFSKLMSAPNFRPKRD